MKKIVIISFLLSTMQLVAQDTIRFGDHRFLWAGDSITYSANCLRDDSYGWSPTEYKTFFISAGYLEYITDHPIYLAGIAVIANTGLQNLTTNGCTSMCGKLYQRDRDGIFLKDSFSVTPTSYADALDSHKIYDYEFPSYCQGSTWAKKDTMILFYYNKPILVHDTFYAGFAPTYMPEFDFSSRCNFFANWKRFGACSSGAYNRVAFPWSDSNTEWCNPESWDIFPAFDYVLASWPILAPDVEDTIPPCPVPNKPILIEAASGFASIKWEANSTVAGYEIAFGTDSINPENNSIIETTSNVKFFSGLENNRYYAAWVRNKCHHNCIWHDTNTYSDWSEPVVFYLSDGNTDPTIIRNVIDLQVKLHPNPAKNEITIETAGVPMQQLELYDIQGRLIKSITHLEDKEKYKLSIDNLPTGRYVVKAITPFGIATQSFVKQ